jgi:hypothetical protein
MSNFQSKNSNKINIKQVKILQIYHIKFLIFTNMEDIYKEEKSIKNKIEYTIANGNTRFVL